MMNFTSVLSRWTQKILVPGLAISLAFGLVTYSTTPVQAQLGVAPTTVPAGGCAIDGNLLSRVPTTAPFSSSNGDFLPNDGAPGSGGYVFTLAGVPVDTAMSFHLIDGYDAADASLFTGGSKFNDNPNNWHWTSGKPPNKDDINNALFFFSSDSAGNLWFVGSGDRKSTNGNTYLDFELLQNPLYKNSGGTFTSQGPDGGRTLGDLVVSITYTIGGTNPQLYIYKWSSTGPGMFNYVSVTPAAGTTYLATNKDSVIVVPYGAFGANVYPKSAFTEIACNLNEVVSGTLSCMDIKTVIVKTKASQSINAALKDFIDPIQINISSAPEVSVNSDTICDGDSAVLTATILSGVGPFTFLWNTGDTTQSITVSPDTTTQYTVVVTGGNGCPSEPATGTVTVLPLPVVEITGTDSICAGDTTILTANVLSGSGPFVYLWSTGDTTQAITVFPDTTTLYSVVVTGGNGCPSEPATFTLTVIPLPVVIITGPDSICIGDTAVLTASVQSGTGPFTYLWSTSDTTQSITVFPDSTTQYTVVVTGGTGCASEPAAFTLTIVPLPVVEITGPDNICSGDTAVLTANVQSGTGPFSYLWNTNDTTQSITVVPDTTTQYTVVVTGGSGCASEPAAFTVNVLPPPTCFITGPDSICPSGSGQFSGPDSLSSYAWTVTGNGTIQGSASDQMVEVLGTGACDSTFTLNLVVTNSGGCSSSCSKTVTLVDTESPVFTDVPEPLSVQCASQVPPAGSDTVGVTDNCAGTITILVSDTVMNQTCPNQFMMVRTWTATDVCGNFSTASQIITVFDSVPPVLLGVPADTGVCCADSVPPPALVTAYDTCDGQVAVALTEVVSDSTAPNFFVLTRTWTAMDSCSNIATAVQVITVNDTLFASGKLGIPEDRSIISFTVTPNPFVSSTKIQFSLSRDASVVLELYNSMGLRLKSLYNGNVTGGSNIMVRLSPDMSMGQGVYLLVLRTNHGVQSKRIVLIK